MTARKQNVWVLGLGESGRAAARLLRAEGAGVTVLDAADTPALREVVRSLDAEGIDVRLGVKELPRESCDLAVVSPGIPADSPWCVELTRRGISLLSELELGWSRRTCRVVAVTGSNGKSTTVKWLAESLREAGLRAAIAGNYGAAVCRVVREAGDLDWLVLEVSSFQLETVRDFRPEVGILLNILPNHLDRHRDLSVYTALKARLFARTLPGDVCLVPSSKSAVVQSLSGGRGRWCTFGCEREAHYRYESGVVRRQDQPMADLQGTRFANDVMGPAAAAVVAAVEACGADPFCAVRAAQKFEPLPHRLQEVAEIGGVRYINDSKATNLAAMGAAIRMVGCPVRLIAGGLAKETDFEGAVESLAGVRRVYLIGRAAEAMYRAWAGRVSCVPCGTLEVAVRRAAAEASAGEAVLLSPACASFDQFRNYEERGERFIEWVRQLAEEPALCRGQSPGLQSPGNVGSPSAGGVFNSSEPAASVCKREVNRHII